MSSEELKATESVAKDDQDPEMDSKATGTIESSEGKTGGEVSLKQTVEAKSESGNEEPKIMEHDPETPAEKADDTETNSTQFANHGSTDSQKSKDESASKRSSIEVSSGRKNTSPQPPKSTATVPGSGGGGQWSSYFKKALSNVENTLDKVLQETDASVQSNSTSHSTNQSPSKPSPQSQSPLPAPEGKAARMSMQERLAMAVGKKTPDLEDSQRKSQEVEGNAARNDGDSSASTAEDSQQPASASKKELSTPINFQTIKSTEPVEIPDLQTPLTMTQNLFELVKLLDFQDGRETILTSFSELVKNMQTQQVRYAELNHQTLEKIDSLESKLKYLSVQEAERAKAGKMGKSGLEKKLSEKDEQIALLFEEGQMLSKKELKQMTTIKKLRSQDQESKKQMENALKAKEKAEKELTSTKEKLNRQTDTIKGLSKSENENEAIRKERNQLKEKVAILEKELEELKSKYDAGIIETQNAALSEANAKADDLQKQLSKLSVENDVSKERHESEISQLKLQLESEQRNNSKAQRDLSEEVRTLENKVEYYRSQSEEVTSGSVGGGAISGDNHANLIRQIEVLQSQHSIATENWHGIESNLLGKISALEKEAEDAKNKESYSRRKFKSLSDTHRESTEQNEQLTDQLQELESDMGRLKTQVAELKSEIDTAREEKTRAQQTHEEQQYKSQEEQQKLRSRIKELETELHDSSEKIALLESTHNAASASPVNSRSSKQPSISGLDAFGIGVPPPPPLSDNSSFLRPFSPPGAASESRRSVSGLRTPSNIGSHFQTPQALDQISDEDFEEAFRKSHSRSGSLGPQDAPDATPNPEDAGSELTASASVATAGPSIQFVGRMNSTIRRLESQLTGTMQDLERMTKKKDDACAQVAELMREQEELTQYKDQVTDLKERLATLEAREQTTLEALGEKSELVSELRADVEDIKAAYKQQVEELVDKLASAGNL